MVTTVRYKAKLHYNGGEVVEKLHSKLRPKLRFSAMAPNEFLIVRSFKIDQDILPGQTAKCEMTVVVSPDLRSFIQPHMEFDLHSLPSQRIASGKIMCVLPSE